MAKLNIRQDAVKHSRGHNPLESTLPLPHGPSGPGWKCNSEVKAGNSGHADIRGWSFFQAHCPCTGVHFLPGINFESILIYIYIYIHLELENKKSFSDTKGLAGQS